MCYKAGSKCFVGNNRGDEGIDASGKESCFHVGWCGYFVPCLSKNLAKSLLRESATYPAMVIK
jgi:hypothetical protein